MRVAGHVFAAGLLLAAAACKGSGEPPTTGAAADTADQVLYGFDHNVTLDGVFRARLTADTAFFYQGSQTALLYGPVVRFYTPTGELSSTVTAIDGTYDWRSGDMEARGEVVAETPDDRVLTTSILRYIRREDRISGPEGSTRPINTWKGTGSRRILTSPTLRRRTRGAVAWVRWR
jgi:LPS export ABC transporter protein LptC